MNSICKFLNLSLSLIFTLTFLSCSSGSSNSTSSDPQLYDVTVSMSPTDGGSVSPADTTVEEGSQINLQATAADNYTFTGWSGAVDATDNPISITVDKDHNLTANFQKKSYELTVDTTGAGTVTEQVISQKTDYVHGTVVELKATPGTAYEFIEWTGDLNSTDNPKTIVVDEPKTVTAHFSVKNDKAAVKINVDWESINQTSSKFTSKNSSSALSITHFGARLIYPKQNAAFAQSVEKVTADSAGIITMEVPPADSARLLVAAVHYNGTNNNQLLKMGVLEDLTIQTGVSYEWGINDITWTDAFWKPADSLATDYESGSFTVDKNKEQFDFYFLVRDPYYPKADPSLENYLIRLNGHGGNSGYENGYRIMRQILENPNVGTVNSEEYNRFHPYLVSELFQLPNEGPRYVVYEEGSVIINWE